VLELLETLAEVGDGTRSGALDPEFAPPRPGEVMHSCLDVERARNELGWEAEVELRDGLQRVLKTL
jgi:UDP-glucose 4-epimerase